MNIFQLLQGLKIPVSVVRFRLQHHVDKKAQQKYRAFFMSENVIAAAC